MATSRVFVRSAIPPNYDVDEASLSTGLFCPPEGSVTQQQFKEEADINVIVRRFGLTGELPENPRPPMSGDFTNVSDFASAMLAVRKAEEGFMEFPAELRYRFHNNPQEMVSFLADAGNRDEAIKLGILPKPPEVPRPVAEPPKAD
jgi:hypothetical protein